MGWLDGLAERMFGSLIARRVAEAVRVVDDEWWSKVQGGGRTLDEEWHARQEDLEDTLVAWRENPLARRIVALTSDYVVGSGILVRSETEQVQRFVDEFWSLNRMRERVYEWCDELTRSGELFVVVRTDPASGMTFVRALPAVWIDEVVTDPGDLEVELRYHQVAANGSEGRWWQAVGRGEDDEQVWHWAINRPVGCVRGSGDLGPLLPWLCRYRDWLENRVRLNKYKTAFLWDVTITGRPGTTESLRKKRFQYKTAPEPGSIIVHDDAEEWQAVSPKIESWDAKEDGKAIRLMVAAGAGVPLHFLSEGESATKATAAEMGDPTYRHYARRQLAFGERLVELMELAWRRANGRGRGWRFGKLGLVCKFPDITQKDNMELAQSAAYIARALEGYARLGLVDQRTATELAMKFAGELVDVQEIMDRVKRDGAVEVSVAAPGAGAGRPAGSSSGLGDSSSRSGSGSAISENAD